MKTETRRGRISPGVLLTVAAVLAVAAVMLPLLWAQRYALFNADDFSLVATQDRTGELSHLVRSLRSAAVSWRIWQGTYSSTFFMLLLSPMYAYSYGLLRAMLMAALIAAAAAGLIFSLLLCGYLGIARKYGALLWALVSLSLMGFREYGEIYLWFTGAMIYLLPLIFMMAAMSLLLLGRRSGKGLWYALAGVSAFLMSGGVLAFVGFGMLLLLLLCLFEWQRTGKLHRGFCAVFMVGLAGALLNALAPGNFARADFSGSFGSGLLSAAAASFRGVGQEAAWLCGTPFPLTLVLALVLGASTGKKLRPAQAWLGVAGLLLLPVISLFPILLGYGLPGITNLSSRTLFPLDLAMILGGVGVAAIGGCALGSRLGLCGGRLPASAAATLALALCLCAFGVWDFVPADITRNLLAGRVQQYSVEWRVVYDYLDQCGNEDVVINRAMPEHCGGCALTKIDAYPDSWGNAGIAGFFGLKSVCMNPPLDWAAGS